MFFVFATQNCFLLARASCRQKKAKALVKTHICYPKHDVSSECDVAMESKKMPADRIPHPIKEPDSARLLVIVT